jgi:hypothetical protein
MMAQVRGSWRPIGLQVLDASAFVSLTTVPGPRNSEPRELRETFPPP